MATPTLSRGGVKIVHAAVDKMFDRLKGRFLGPDFVRGNDKRILFQIGYRPDLSLPGIYRAAAVEEAARPDETVLHSLGATAEAYLDAQREQTKARVTQAVNAWLVDAAKSKVKTNVETVLGGQLADIWKQMTNALVTVVDSESTRARNVGVLEGISRVNASAGIDDPTVYFVIVRDTETCKECKRLHLLSDSPKPRLWKLSEVSSGYHKRGEETPSIGGLHPHCRCTLATLMPGYGFNVAGSVEFVAFGHDEFRVQRG